MSDVQEHNDAAFFAWPMPRGGGSSANPVSSPAISIVAPMYNEAGGAAALIAEIAAALEGADYEIIAVDDASSDETVMALSGARVSGLRILRHKKNAGQSRALRTGILAARGTVIVTLDGDGQNDPADIPLLLGALRGADASTVMIAGERRERKDGAAKKWASGIANSLRKRLLKDGADDTGCGLKVFYREAFLRLPYFDHMHRYLPALMRREGFHVEFLAVNHRPRAHGASKYTNMGRLMVAFRDLSGVFWLLGRFRSPGAVEEIDL